MHMQRQTSNDNPKYTLSAVGRLSLCVACVLSIHLSPSLIPSLRSLDFPCMSPDSSYTVTFPPLRSPDSLLIVSSRTISWFLLHSLLTSSVRSFYSSSMACWFLLYGWQGEEGTGGRGGRGQIAFYGLKLPHIEVTWHLNQDSRSLYYLVREIPLWHLDIHHNNINYTAISFFKGWGKGDTENASASEHKA